MGKSKNTAGIENIENDEQESYYVEEELQDFEERQVNVTRTLQMIVYPAMVAFIILSAYGFYLVQSLTTDVHRLTETIAEMNKSVNDNMTVMTGNITSMSSQMSELVTSTNQMTHSVIGMNSSTQDMAGNIQQMNASTQNMAVSTYNMQRDMWSMNKNISGSMKMFNKFSPFGSDKTAPYVVPPPAMTAMPYYNNYYAWPQMQATTTAAQPGATVQPSATAQTEAETPVAPTATLPQVESPLEGGDSMEEAPAGGAATAKDGHSSIDDPLQQQVLASAIKG